MLREWQEKPEEKSIARVQYTSWTKDGKIAETTTTRKGHRFFSWGYDVELQGCSAVTKGKGTNMGTRKDFRIYRKKNKPQVTWYMTSKLDFQTTKAPPKVEVPALPMSRHHTAMPRRQHPDWHTRFDPRKRHRKAQARCFRYLDTRDGQQTVDVRHVTETGKY